MKIRRLSLIDFELTFKAPLVTAHGLLNLRKGIIICAKTDDGFSGIGEISPLDGFNRESRSRAKQSAQEVAGYLDNAELPVDPEGLIQILGDLEDRLSAPPSVIFGFEMLLGDLAGKKAELPLSTWYCNDPLRNVAVNAIQCITQGQLAQKAARHFRAYKIKIEAGGIEPAIQKIKTVRDRVADDVMIRLDLNRGLDLNEAVDLLNEIKGFGIEYVEEPLKEPTSHDMIALREETGLRIALDESVKLSRMAAEQGLKTVLTSTLESGIGVAACLHAAAMLGHHVLACGLDTLDLFQDSIINEDLPIISGRMNVPQRPGLGVSLRPSLIPSTI